MDLARSVIRLLIDFDFTAAKRELMKPHCVFIAGTFTFFISRGLKEIALTKFPSIPSPLKTANFASI
jgi:hypothetical protein